MKDAIVENPMAYPALNSVAPLTRDYKELVYLLASQLGIGKSLFLDLTDDPFYNERGKEVFFQYLGTDTEFTHTLREAIRNEIGLKEALKISILRF